jgi:hypothetical protein
MELVIDASELKLNIILLTNHDKCEYDRGHHDGVEGEGAHRDVE